MQSFFVFDIFRACQRKSNALNAGKESEYSSDNKFRPFCTERCQLLDLGAWTEGQYTVPGPEASPEEMTEAFLQDSKEDDDDPESKPNYLH